MLSIKTWKAGGEAELYYTREVKHEYYARGDEEGGQWRGAGELGLADGSAVKPEYLAAVLSGFSPEDGRALCQGAGERHRPGYDLTFSAPKSVSVLWALGDERVREVVFGCHKAACEAGLAHMEAYGGMARRGRDGVRIEPVKGLISASFDHASSREGDPQLHTHCFIANLAERTDGTWGAIESKYLYKEKMGAGAVYRAELSVELSRRLGVEISRRGKEFEIANVSKDLVDTFSKRRSQIVADMEKKGFDTARAAERSNLDTRRAKEVKDFDSLRLEWKSVGQEMGFEQSRVISRSVFSEPKLDRSQEISQITRSLTEKQSSFTGREFRREVATGAQGRFGREGIEFVTAGLNGHRDTIGLGMDLDGQRRYTTR